ncbi:MAG TPA: Ig-like domain-containing protein [Terriglobales bacterium]
MRTLSSVATTLIICLLTACSGGGGTHSGGFGTPAAGVTSIQVSPTSISIGMGAQQQFHASAHLSDGTSQDITSSATWRSSDSNIASVNAAGIATGSGSGTVTIKAQSGSMTSSGSLTVTAAAANLVSIAIAPAASSMPVNTSQQFTATGTYSDGRSADLTALVTWSSSTSATAAVDVTGMVSALAAGSTNISAVFAGVSQSTVLTVTAPTIVSIAVTPVGQTLGIGISEQYVATATYSDGSSSDLSSGVTWTSSTPAVATVTAAGVITTVAAGNTNITATLGALTDSSTMTVVAAHLTSIAVSPAVQSIAAGTTLQFSAVGSFDDGSTQLLTNLTWSSTTLATATVNTLGVVTGVGSGTSTITATSGSVSGTAALTVTGATLVSLAVTPPNSTMAIGTTKQFIATGTFSDASTQDITSTVVWTSSNPVAATINAQGLATSSVNGSTTIAAGFGAITGSTGLTVTTVHLISITVSPATPRISKGTSIKFTATGTFSDSSVATNLSGVSWKSSKPNLASIRSTGIAHGKKSGTVTITASSSGVSGATTLTIGTGTLVSVALTPAAPTAAAGGTQQFVATGTFSDASTQDISLNSHWSSSHATVATIANAPSVAGLAHCVAAGTSSIGVNSGGITGSTVLTVQ